MQSAVSCSLAEPITSGKFSWHLVGELRPHPGLLHHGLLPAVQKLSALADRGELAFSDPLTVTEEGIILDGYARWTLAKQQGREALLCLRKPLSEDEALVALLQAQHRTSHLNDFSRILLALELEVHFREAARRNQQAGGRSKLPSDLTKARSIDVRQEVARAAGASAGNVNHAKFLLEKAAPEVLIALKAGKVRIGRARKWLSTSRDAGRRELRHFLIKREMNATSRKLLSFHPTPAVMKSDEGYGPLLDHFGIHGQRGLLAHLLRTLPESAVREVIAQAGMRDVR